MYIVVLSPRPFTVALRGKRDLLVGPRDLVRGKRDLPTLAYLSFGAFADRKVESSDVGDCFHTRLPFHTI